MNLDNIRARFRELSKLTETEAADYASLITSAKAHFEKQLVREPSDDSETALCEYACACRAFFDYAVLLAATENTYSTKTGGVLARNYSDTVIHARRLMNNAAAALPEGLYSADDFVFESTEG